MLAHRLVSIKTALVQRLVFAGLRAGLLVVTADTDSMSVECWASVSCAGQYSFSPSQYFMVAVPA